MSNSLKLLSKTIGAPVDVNPATGNPPLWKMALDVERCIGCHACSVACKVEHAVPLGRYRTKVYYWEHGKFPEVKRNFLPTLCMQCEDAPCLKACPNNGKSLCAKGQSGPTINDYPERILFPMKRVGKRGEGKWMRITWDEAHAEIARRIRKAMDEGKPEEVAIQIGRSRLAEEMGRFLNAIGSPSLFNHRALCSSNKRAANYASLGETDWESGDFERSKYIIDFGANVYEAHQGAIHAAKRIICGRYDNGAKFVYFDVRLSNTAGRADEWFAPNPGSDGARFSRQPRRPRGQRGLNPAAAQVRSLDNSPAREHNRAP